MIKIAIYLGPLVGESVDAREVVKGNPGVGGTQYCMLELAHYLNQQSHYKVTIFASRTYVLERGLEFIKISGDNTLCETIQSMRFDILILSQFRNRALEHDIAKMNCKVVVWSHNYLYSDFCNFINNTSNVKANVFVGKQQYDRYIDHDVIKKSTYIYNMFFDNSPHLERHNDSKTVVYMGALVEGKGFAELCSIWPDIIKEVPDAQLLVMGSGALYGDAKMGTYGLADQAYEDKFIKNITDKDGKLVPSVHFLGVVGEGKTDLFRKASVGVVNPSGRTETFGMGVVEMAEAKLPVVTIGKNGYFDTVKHNQTGLLGKNLDEIRHYIVSLLKDTSLNEKLGSCAKENLHNYFPDKIGPLWDELILQVYEDCYRPRYLGVSKPFCNNLKWARVCLRFLRMNIYLKFLPALIDLESFYVRIKNKR